MAKTRPDTLTLTGAAADAFFRGAQRVDLARPLVATCRQGVAAQGRASPAKKDKAPPKPGTDPLLRDPVVGTYILTKGRELVHVLAVETETRRPVLMWSSRSTEISRAIEQQRLDKLPDVVQTRVRYMQWRTADADWGYNGSELLPQWRRRVFGAQVVGADFREKALAENKRRAIERAHRVLELEVCGNPALSRLESAAAVLDKFCLADPCAEHSQARLHVEYALLALRKRAGRSAAEDSQGKVAHEAG